MYIQCIFPRQGERTNIGPASEANPLRRYKARFIFNTNWLIQIAKSGYAILVRRQPLPQNLD